MARPVNSTLGSRLTNTLPTRSCSATGSSKPRTLQRTEVVVERTILLHQDDNVPD